MPEGHLQRTARPCGVKHGIWANSRLPLIRQTCIAQDLLPFDRQHSWVTRTCLVRIPLETGLCLFELVPTLCGGFFRETKRNQASRSVKRETKRTANAILRPGSKWVHAGPPGPDASRHSTIQTLDHVASFSHKHPIEQEATW